MPPANRRASGWQTPGLTLPGTLHAIKRRAEGEALYLGLVFLHLAGLVLFVLCHGASAFMAFLIRRQSDPAVVNSYLGMSNAANRLMYLGLLLLAVGGLGAAWNSSLLATPWVLATTATLIAVLAVMYAIGARFYYGLRDRLKPGPDGQVTLGGPELSALLQNRVPETLAAVGTLGLIVMVGLMVFKPA